MGTLFVNGKIQENDPELPFKYQEYLNYIDEHRKNVVSAFIKEFLTRDFIIPSDFGISKEEWDSAIRKVSEDILDHDKSKYEDDEFYAYRRKHNQTTLEKNETDPDILQKVDEEYEIAWEHHYKHNYHHPEFWRFVTIEPDGTIIHQEERLSIPTPMPLYAIIHMISDWQGMYYKFHTGDSCVDWYNADSKSERMSMNPATRELVAKILEFVFDQKVLVKED